MTKHHCHSRFPIAKPEQRRRELPPGAPLCPPAFAWNRIRRGWRRWRHWRWGELHNFRIGNNAETCQCARLSGQTRQPEFATCIQSHGSRSGQCGATTLQCLYDKFRQVCGPWPISVQSRFRLVNERTAPRSFSVILKWQVNQRLGACFL